ncbi:LysR family transcriptional regulator [Pseudomonas citronellolis]|uniref:LysR family transcriptional regulator n=1 Tax=Pseudomonas citronellolis TaxID=53408 RepID=UPI00209EBCDB|nr:LysR family transcriptional regulator [Pseudomonas citronellolis]MCP1607822.1 DNA-binding transcriptional LysR family regulator [Pseudomonas citronellolis]MCP1658817.1 DNA-binding transcriptional LysR family regulator [Pseudomonas citronellolis]MCP1725766.1 DNA-binding transcriptional LysR family regulator [Pseudomonas citronellolis]MDN6876494.1 LysR family transcriptional regulator [Pseudomonas citronellolis]
MDLFEGMQAFIRVVESGSFTGAAEGLGMSTSKVSRLVAGLESELSARLLQRTTRSLAVTDIGMRYFERCKRILGEVAEAAAEVGGARAQAMGRLRVHAVTEFGLEHLTPLLVDYLEHYPEVSIDLSLTQGAPAMLEEGFDVLITLAEALPDSSFVAQRLGQVFSIVCASPDYLAKHGVPQAVEDLHGHRCLQLADSLSPQGWRFSGPQGEQLVELGDVLKVNLPEAACVAAASGLGVCLLPSFVAAKALLDGSLVRILPAYRLHARDVFALYSSRHYLDEKIRTWVEFLKARLPEAFDRDRQILDDPGFWAEAGKGRLRA